jgi:hypothetical protein
VATRESVDGTDGGMGKFLVEKPNGDGMTRVQGGGQQRCWFIGSEERRPFLGSISTSPCGLEWCVQQAHGHRS